MKNPALRNIAYQTLLDLATDEGINASGKEEIYGCIFGRDSFITILHILQAHNNKPDQELLNICKRSLQTLITLQGQEFNLESGEEPGKFIHEFRREKHHHLTTGRTQNDQKPWENPWYLYDDNSIRSYDSIDSTPLGLIALYKYYQVTKDGEFLMSILPSVEAALNWIITFGDSDKDLLLEYNFNFERNHGGLLVQSWTDSHESLRDHKDQMPKYPIAPVEAQGYAWLALRLWGDFYADHSPAFAQKLISQAQAMKKRFNETFIFKEGNHYYAAQALDGDKKQIKTVTGNPLLLLWAASRKWGMTESILEWRYISHIVKRAFEDDLFDKDAGIRTMSTSSLTFNANQDSYHNGSFWPVLNGMAYEGLQNFDYLKEAEKLKKASLKPLAYFGTPIELYIKGENGDYLEFKGPDGQVSCRSQAWTAAVLLDMATEQKLIIKLLMFLRATPKEVISLSLLPITIFSDLLRLR